MSETQEIETVVVEVTPLFYSRESMTEAASFCHGDKGTIVFAWSRVELERGQSAEIKAKTTVKQNKVTLESRFVDTAGFKAMEKAGMIKILPGEDITPVLTDAQFEQFWNVMPFRLVSGHKTRGSKANAKRMFHKFIRKQEQFDTLMTAVAEYSVIANGFPKDAERFLRNNFWVDFVPKPDAGTSVAVPQTDEDKRRVQAEREQALQS